jgi:ketosteroid isomerase-like protein
MSIKTIVVSLFLWVVCSCLSAENAINELLQLEKDFQNAIVKNDSTAIGQFLADDWIVVDSQGQIIDKAKFLAIIKSGTLTHDQMNLEMPRIRLYENTAVITGRASSSGKYLGTQFKTLEQSTDVFTKIDGRWRCVLTHLTSLNEEAVVKTRAEAEGTSAPH